MGGDLATDGANHQVVQLAVPVRTENQQLGAASSIEQRSSDQTRDSFGANCDVGSKFCDLRGSRFEPFSKLFLEQLDFTDTDRDGVTEGNWGHWRLDDAYQS